MWNDRLLDDLYKRVEVGIVLNTIMIKNNGKLRFGNIDEPKPEYNEKGEKLFWYDEIDDPCKHLDVKS